MTIIENQIMLPEATIISKIFLIRGKKIILDRDLANFYGIETRRLKEQIRLVRIFNKMREMLQSNKELIVVLEQLRDKINDHDDKFILINNKNSIRLNPEGLYVCRKYDSAETVRPRGSNISFQHSLSINMRCLRHLFNLQSTQTNIRF